MILQLDLETFCETPIRSGTSRYAEDAEVLLSAFAIDDEPVLVRGPSGYGELHCSSIGRDGKLLHSDYTNWLEVPEQTSVHTSPEAAHLDCWAKNRL